MREWIVASSVSPGDVGGAPDSLDGGWVDTERERESERENIVYTC